ncbi:hypothetical protein Tco_0172677 [Tanacetum coccineum]
MAHSPSLTSTTYNTVPKGEPNPQGECGIADGGVGCGGVGDGEVVTWRQRGGGGSGGEWVVVMERARGGARTSESSRSGGGECFGARPEFWQEMVLAPEYSPESMAAAVAGLFFR